MGSIEIRALKREEEFRACEGIQKRVWGTVAVSSEVLMVTQKYGGAVFGALAGRRVVGFLYAFLARYHNKMIHWSHMMAVEPRFRDQGLGFRMKLAHRKLALQRGIPYICWTFDPLMSRNATLNFTRLGARAVEYIPDCYGRFPSRIERGLASDRLVVSWSVASRAVEKRLQHRPARALLPDLPRVNYTDRNGSGYLVNRRIDPTRSELRLLFEIPSNTDLLRAHALPLARRWRLETRRIFLRYLASGYAVADFIPPAAGGGSCFYVLDRLRKARTGNHP